jgi:transcriptional antiterminator
MNLQNENRESEILYLLLNCSDYLTIEKIASRLGVSKRTIQNDIDKLMQRIHEMGLQNRIEVEKKSGSGIKMRSIGNCIDLLGLNDSPAFRSDSDQWGQDRRMEILNMLLNSDSELTMQFLADQFYTSKSVIAKDLSWIEGWLSNYNLGIDRARHKGILVSGNERDRRNAIVQLLIISKSSGLAAVGGLQRRLGEDKYNQILKTHSKIYAEKLNLIIIQAENEFKFSLSDEHYYSLLIHMLISIERLLHGKYISGGDELLYSQCGKTEMEIAEYIASKVEKEFNTAVPLDERVYICMHLMGSSIYEDIAAEGMRSATANIPARVKLLCSELVKFVSRFLGEDFEQDELLVIGLMFHLKMSIYRIRNGFASNAPEKASVNPRHENVYKAVWAAGMLYERYYKISVTEEELHALSAYFIMSLKRFRQKKRIVVASDGGIAPALELSERLLEKLPDLGIADVCSFYQLGCKDPSEYDAVISCKEPGNLKMPFLSVKPMPDKADIEGINAFLSSRKKDSPETEESKIQGQPVETVELASRNGAQLLKDINDFLAPNEGDGSVSGKIGFENSLVIGDRMWIRINPEEQGTSRTIRFSLRAQILAGGAWLKDVMVGILPGVDADEYCSAAGRFLND